MRDGTRDVSDFQVTKVKFGRWLNRRLILVDTPGIDDSNQQASQARVMSKMTAWLEKKYVFGAYLIGFGLTLRAAASYKSRHISGIIWVHDTTVALVRHSYPSTKTLQAFKKLLGTESLERLVLVEAWPEKMPNESLEARWRREEAWEEASQALVAPGSAWHAMVTKNRAHRMKMNTRDINDTNAVLEHLLRFQPPDDILILVMGPTGVGKSKIIKAITGCDTIEEGHGLTSCTKDVSCYSVAEPKVFGSQANENLILVDTPGFDDTYDDGTQVLKKVSEWLKDSYCDKKKLSGIVYLGDITQKRMGGSARLNFKVFKELCGRESFQGVVMATSHWDELITPISREAGVKREKELRETFWKDVLAGGGAMMRIEYDAQGQLRGDTPVHHILRLQNRLKLKIQEEIVDLEKSLPATKAGRTLKAELEEYLASLRERTGEDSERPEIKTVAESRRRRIKAQIEELKLPLSERLKTALGL
ncbi:TKL/TKL-ccin protein kinase, variant 2 [Coprinopsis cinerea AmutBmut pab1-1]|nr:TKL/TKL-ccin protein kinase, variant 2 [Coprinopsis cinerea AmutBmut pab1-1]